MVGWLGLSKATPKIRQRCTFSIGQNHLDAKRSRDLIRLRDFLATESPEAAARAVYVIREGLGTLKIAPQAGRPIQWLPEGYREWFIPFGKNGYLVLYRHLEGVVAIQALRHGREANYLHH
jgi:plasmid stabilization system protein ParE